MSSRGKRSMVWEFFDLTTDNKFVMCRVCKKQYKYFKNTTNLKEHLKRVHPSQLLVLPRRNLKEEDEPATPQPSTSTENTATSQASTSTSTSTEVKTTAPLAAKTIPKRHTRQLRLFASRSTTELADGQVAEINLALIKMIVADYQPLRIVEDKGFQEFVRKLNPLFTIPSRKMLSTQLIPQLYQSEVEKLREKLASVQHVGVTTDMWTSDSNIHYVTVTIHFIENSILHASALQTSAVTGSQTGVHVASELADIFNEWEIIEKIVTVVSDNGANIKSAINDHLRKHHHPCVAHTLNLSAKDCLTQNKELGGVLEKCRHIVGHFKHSALAAEKLSNMQQQLNVAHLKVKQDVATRWNSTYTMLLRLIEIKVPITAVMSSLPKAPQMLNAEEWLVIEDCIPVLKPLDLMTTVLSGEKYVTLSSIIPLVRGLQHSPFHDALALMNGIEYLPKQLSWIPVTKNKHLGAKKIQMMQRNGCWKNLGVFLLGLHLKLHLLHLKRMYNKEVPLTLICCGSTLTEN